MKRFVAYMSWVALCCSMVVVFWAAPSPIYGPGSCNITAKETGHASILTYDAIALNHDATRQCSLAPVPGLAPQEHTILFTGLLPIRYAVPFQNREATRLIALSVSHALRFEGPDIVHPFHCFW
jgi:hypothetical protein